MLMLMLWLANKLPDLDIDLDALCDCDLSRDSLMLRDSDLLIDLDATRDWLLNALWLSFIDALRDMLKLCDLD